MNENGLKLTVEKDVEHVLENNREKHYKKKLKVYIDNINQRLLIDNAAAYVLKLITYKEWMGNTNGYYEITDEQLLMFSNTYEIEYEQWNKKKLKVYIDDINQRLLIDNAAAYALKLIAYEEWMKNPNGYYEIDTYLLLELNEFCEIEYYDFGMLSQEKTSKTDFGNNDSLEIIKLKEMREQIIKEKEMDKKNSGYLNAENLDLIRTK